MAKLKKQRKKCKGSDGLESLVIEYHPKRDSHGNKYIPLCHFKHHVGISLKPEVCEKRQCKYYEKVYINKNIKIHYEK